MASIIITGATGTGKYQSCSPSSQPDSSLTPTVGSAVLTQALASPSISKVTVLARRAPAVQNPKLETILLPSETFPEGFSSWPEGLVERVRSRQPTAVVWALGVSQRDVKEDEYVK
jgi:hypothetical protein